MKQYKLKSGNILRVSYCEAEDPRKWNNLSTIIYHHSNYEVGDERIEGMVDQLQRLCTEFHIASYIRDLEPEENEYWGDTEKLQEFLQNRSSGGIILPCIFKAWYSEPELEILDFHHPNIEGFIFITPDKIVEEYGSYSQENLEKAHAVLMSELKVYNHYLSSSTYKFEVIRLNKCDHCGHVEEEIIDSCGGFYGCDVTENGIMDNINDELAEEVTKT